MADKKISQLTAATTPLDGTEVLPIVQSSATVKVANNDLRPKQIQSNATSGVLQIAGPAAATTRVMTVPNANFTAARTDAAQSFTGDQTLSTGNLIQGTAAKGFTTGGVFALGLGTNGSTSQATVNTDGSLTLTGGVQIGSPQAGISYTENKCTAVSVGNGGTLAYTMAGNYQGMALLSNQSDGKCALVIFNGVNGVSTISDPGTILTNLPITKSSGTITVTNNTGSTKSLSLTIFASS